MWRLPGSRRKWQRRAPLPAPTGTGASKRAQVADVCFDIVLPPQSQRSLRTSLVDDSQIALNQSIGRDRTARQYQVAAIENRGVHEALASEHADFSEAENIVKHS